MLNERLESWSFFTQTDLIFLEEYKSEFGENKEGQTEETCRVQNVQTDIFEPEYNSNLCALNIFSVY